jgi:hypothetical protein
MEAEKHRPDITVVLTDLDSVCAGLSLGGARSQSGGGPAIWTELIVRRRLSYPEQPLPRSSRGGRPMPHNHVGCD